MLKEQLGAMVKKYTLTGYQGSEPDVIPLADVSTPASPLPSFSPSLNDFSDDGLTSPVRAQDPDMIRGFTRGPVMEDRTPSPIREITFPVPQTPAILTRSQRWAAFISIHFDHLTYLIIFLFVGIPIYYSTGYAMPAHLTFNVLMYFVALSLPAKWKRFAHPVLVSSFLTCMGIWVLGLIRGNSLDHVLTVYKTGTGYEKLWHHEKNLALPGAGDLLVTVLDVSFPPSSFSP